jgi:hypothetical protein
LQHAISNVQQPGLLVRFQHVLLVQRQYIDHVLDEVALFAIKLAGVVLQLDDEAKPLIGSHLLAVSIDREEKCKQERKNECHSISFQSTHCFLSIGVHGWAGSFGLVAAGEASTAGNAEDDHAGKEWGDPARSFGDADALGPPPSPPAAGWEGGAAGGDFGCSMTNRVFIIPSKASMCTL